MASFSSSSSSSISSSTSSLPQILSHTAVPGLVGDLDASDVLECYRLTRNAVLHVPFGDHTPPTTASNATRYITTKKTAIGLRYHPNKKQQLASTNFIKLPLELTLEYGPTRFGLDQRNEAVPHVQVLEEDSNTAKLVSYENEAKLYFTTDIDSKEWTSASYMGSLTGAVLPNLLSQALEYAAHHPRYQPFQVYQMKEIEQEEGSERKMTEPKLVLKSSSSSDFVEFMWESLASVGVELEPILSPSVHQARLFVSSIEKVSGVDEESHELVTTLAYRFYNKLQHCVTALATGDYTDFTPTQAPSSSPIPSSAPTSLTDNSTMSPTMGFNSTDEALQKEEGSDMDTDGNSTTTDDVTRKDQDEHHSSRWYSRWRHPHSIRKLQEVAGEESRTKDTTQDETDSSHVPTLSPSLSPTVSSAPTANMTLAPTSSSTMNEAEQAAQAATEAKEAAAQAKNEAHTDAESKAATAAEAAAQAAQKAADATQTKTQQQSMEGLLSGDGSAMSTVLTQCITNPQYQINASQAYLYLDGAFYYKLNLTPPYLDVVTMDRPIPRPPLLNAGGGGDFVDWILAFVLFGLLGLCFLITCQQIGIPIIPPLYKLQRAFFSPRHFDEEDDRDNKGQGFQHAFAEDVIPLSMGGRKPMMLPAHDEEDLMEEVQDRGSSHEMSNIHLGGGDLEMVSTADLETPVAFVRTRSGLSSDGRIDGSSHSRGMANSLPRRLSRDPELVDLPHLQSTSKVAVPVSLSVSEHQNDDSLSTSGHDSTNGENTYKIRVV